MLVVESRLALGRQVLRSLGLSTLVRWFDVIASKVCSWCCFISRTCAANRCSINKLFWSILVAIWLRASSSILVILDVITWLKSTGESPAVAVALCVLPPCEREGGRVDGGDATGTFAGVMLDFGSLLGVFDVVLSFNGGLTGGGPTSTPDRAAGSSGGSATVCCDWGRFCATHWRKVTSYLDPKNCLLTLDQFSV